ncbi:U32 family peptidase, partial [Patescibacteria group bacterium]|nr:U32 family peptidase [Patescibacteria group bacterium]
MNKPEILAPAGTFEKLKLAFQYGADACYMGLKTMGMRMKIDDEGGDVLEEALKLKNKLGKKIYLTMNVHAHEYKLNFLDKEIERLTELHAKGLDPDGILASDVGVISILQQKTPWLEIHVSTQANTLNSAAIEYWAKQGITRVVLGREVSLRELKQIRKQLKKDGIDVEIEGFVHGAMCMAYSGRCLLSSFMASRCANEGMCAHSCRWKYKLHMEEEERPGQYIPIEEDENGTYIMSSKDMSMIEHLKDLIDAGLDSLKIEGRHKTEYYVAIASRAYREALDLTMEGKPPTPEILDLIESINTRGYFTGFWYGKPGAEGQNYEDRGNYNDNYCFAGIIRKVDGNKVTIEIRNRLD